MKDSRKRIKHIVISVTICLALAAASGGYASDVLSGRTEAYGTAESVYAAAKETDDSTGDKTGDEEDAQSSFEYKQYQSHKTYRNVLRIKMPDVYSGISDNLIDETTLPIPGTLVTCASSDGEIMSDEYISQGICSAERYWLVTAYDSKKKNPSVIYVVDSGNKELVSTVLLPNKYHVGGIAFDGKRIWLTGDTSDRYKGRPFVQFIRYNDFLDKINDSVAEVTENDISEKIYIKNKPSFLECDSGRLWVGTYIGTKETKEAYIYGYPIIDTDYMADGADDSGAADGTASGNGGLNTILYSIVTGIDSSAQGMDIDDKYLYISSSYKGNSVGVKSSFVTKYEISPVLNDQPYLYAADREVNRVEVPKMNEEILVDGDSIHINFESAANRWANPVIRTDRILAVKKSVWEK